MKTFSKAKNWIAGLSFCFVSYHSFAEWKEYTIHDTQLSDAVKIAVGESKENTTIATKAWRGTEPARLEHQEPLIYVSKDGRKWDQVHIVTTSNSGLTKIFYTGTEYVAWGAGLYYDLTTRSTFGKASIVVSSKDGFHWSEKVLPRLEGYIQDLAFYKGKYLLIDSENGHLWESQDLKQWTLQRTLPVGYGAGFSIIKNHIIVTSEACSFLGSKDGNDWEYYEIRQNPRACWLRPRSTQDDENFSAELIHGGPAYIQVENLVVDLKNPRLDNMYNQVDLIEDFQNFKSIPSIKLNGKDVSVNNFQTKYSDYYKRDPHILEYIEDVRSWGTISTLNTAKENSVPGYSSESSAYIGGGYASVKKSGDLLFAIFSNKIKISDDGKNWQEVLSFPKQPWKRLGQ